MHIENYIIKVHIMHIMINSDWFKNRLNALGLTQDDVARALGKNRTTFGRLIGGQIEFKLQHAQALAPLFKTSVEEILVKAGLRLKDKENNMLENIETAIEAFKNGEILIVTDDDDRENEGDLIVAANKCTPEQMAFIIRHTSGIVCTPLSEKRARELNLNPMVAQNNAPLATAFTVTVDARHGTTTGISAAERCNTVHVIANNNSTADDLVRPGHVFPLIAREGGVLVRTGHTEATVDLCRLAGLPEVGVICEMVNDDGSVMRGDDIKLFSQKHNIKHISIEQLIAYRQSREKLIDKTSEFTIESEIGTLRAISYKSHFDNVQHLALIYGRINDGDDIPVRLHRGDIVDDVFGGRDSINSALQKFKTLGRGVLIYLRDGSVGVPSNLSAQSHSSEEKRNVVWREIGIGAQIIRDLGINSIHLLTRSQLKFAGLDGFGIKIAKTEGL